MGFCGNKEIVLTLLQPRYIPDGFGLVSFRFVLGIISHEGRIGEASQ